MYAYCPSFELGVFAQAGQAARISACCSSGASHHPAAGMCPLHTRTWQPVWSWRAIAAACMGPSPCRQLLQTPKQTAG